MRNPARSAFISAVALVICGWPIIFPGPEAPSPALAALQWVLVACCAIGLVGSLIQMASRR